MAAVTTEQLSTLVEKYKTANHLTWEDTARDASVLLSLQLGAEFISDYAGTVCDFLTPGLPQALLLNYAFYDQNKASEQFEQNYLHNLLQLRKRAMADYQAQKEEAETDDS